MIDWKRVPTENVDETQAPFDGKSYMGYMGCNV